MSDNQEQKGAAMSEKKSVVETIKSWSIIATAISAAFMFSSITYLAVSDKFEDMEKENKKEKEEFSIKFKRPADLKNYSEIDVRINGVSQFTSYNDVKHLDGDSIIIPLRIEEYRRPTMISKATLYHYNEWGLRLDILSNETVNTNKSISLDVEYMTDSLYVGRILKLEAYSDSILNTIRSIEAGLGTMAKAGWIFELDSNKSISKHKPESK